MKLRAIKPFISLSLAVAAVGLPLFSPMTWAQAPWPSAPPPMMAVPTTPTAQRNALNSVRAQVGWLQNATRTASSYATGGADMIWQQFQTLRGTYNTFTMTLNARQAASGANELAELGAGLDIIQEAFANYQSDLAGGRSPSVALNDLCRVIREASGVWLQKLNQDCARVRVGW